MDRVKAKAKAAALSLAGDPSRRCAGSTFDGAGATEMAVKFTSNASAQSYLPDAAPVRDMTVSFWLKMSTLPDAGTSERRNNVGLMQAIYAAPDPADDAYPWLMAIVAIDDALYSLFDGRPAFSVDRGRHYWAWDITADGLEIDIADGEWHHHCLVSRASSGSLDWYIDNVLQRPADSQVIDSTEWTGDWRRGSFVGDVSIGAEGADYLGALATDAGVEIISAAPDGPMAEMAIWSVALSGSEIAKLVAGAPASLVRQSALVSYQRLFETGRNFVAAADGVRTPEFGLVGYQETVVSTAASSHSVALPAGTEAGQLALLIGTTFEQTFSTPSGFSLRETNTTDGETSVMTKTLVEGDLSGITVSCAGNTRGIWHAYVFNDAQRPAQIDLMETDLEVGERATFFGSNVIKVMYARTRRTDNTLTLDEAYDEVISSETGSAQTGTDHGRLVSGYRGPEWDKITDAATAAIAGTTDAIRAGTYIISAANHESGISDGADVEDHPPAVVAYAAEIESRVYTVKANGRDTGAEQRHDPDARLDYAWDWSDWLRDGEVIDTAETDSDEGITVDPVQHDGLRAFAWIEGGTNGTTYAVTCRITTNQGRTDDRTMSIFVLER